MRKILSLLLAVCMLFSLCGCTSPDSLQLDLYKNYGDKVKLLHINAAADENVESIEKFLSLLTESRPSENDLSSFSEEPEYRLEIYGKTLSVGEDGALSISDCEVSSEPDISVLIDVFGERVDFTFSGGETVYRSDLTADELQDIINRA